MMLQKKKIEVEMMNTKISDFSSEKNKETIIINSDVYAGLDYLEDNSIQCAVTSPPYWGQRDYGFKGQIGNEKKYSEFIEKLESIYRKLKEKLDSKGIFFLNIGDKYLSRYGNSKLGMIPYKLAKFMKDNGWILVDTIIWYKPNHMPGSYTNRFTSTYEPVFVFAKNIPPLSRGGREGLGQDFFYFLSPRFALAKRVKNLLGGHELYKAVPNNTPIESISISLAEP